MEILKNMVNGVGSAAMLLAMTGTMTDEQYLKSYLTSLGYKVAVTEVSGKYRSSAFQSQMIRSVLGAVLNQEVISKNSYDVHAVLHALVDAKKASLGRVGIPRIWRLRLLLPVRIHGSRPPFTAGPLSTI